MTDVFDSYSALIKTLREQYSGGDPVEVFEDLKKRYGQVWDEPSFNQEFTEVGQTGPYKLVIKNDEQKYGSLVYTDSPRFYFLFHELDEAQND